MSTDPTPVTTDPTPAAASTPNTPAVTPAPANAAATPGVESVKTGDTVNTGLAMILALIAVAGMCLIAFDSKKKSRR